MLCCVYHPVFKYRVVEEDVRDNLLKTGVWFNTPTEANQLREDYEAQKREETVQDGKGLCGSGKSRNRKTERKA